METNSESAVISKNFIYFLSAVIVVLLMVLYLQGQLPIKKGELADPDCYTRLNRVVRLHDTGQWYDSINTRSNAPFGENLHWTRPLDVFLLTGAWLASPLAGFKTSLFWWGVLISPFLLAASLIILPWAFRPVLSSDSNLVSLLFVFQFGILSFYSIGRPDHNSLIGLTFIISTGLILRIIVYSFNKTVCLIAGMISAFSLWLHVESLLVIFINILLFGFFWIFEDEDFIEKNRHYSIALFFFTGIALILERPWYNLGSIEYDKISIVHLFIFGLVSLFWTIVFYFKKRPMIARQERVKRFMSASLGAVMVALCVWLVFPDFYRGGYADIDPGIVPIWLNKVIEVQSPLSKDFLLPLIQLLSSAVVGVAYIFVILRESHYENLKKWIFILSGILLFTLAGIFERRLLLYGNIITLVPLAALLGRTLRWEVGHLKFIFRSFILPFTIIFFCTAFLIMGFFCEKYFNKDVVKKVDNQSIPLAQLCDELNNLGAGRARPIRMLAHIDYGPEILYRTNDEVIATPYHRNAQGILDTFKIMTAESDEDAHKLIRKRKIDMILISNNPGEINFISAAARKSNFYNRLKAGEYVYWLKAVELPSRLSFYYKLFQIVG